MYKVPTILADDHTLKLNFWIGIFLTAMVASFGVGITIYSYSIFLSSYPVSWIPLWMLSESVLIFLLGSFLAFFNPTNFKRYSQIILFGIAILSFISIILTANNWFWGPFLIVLILRSCSNIMSAAIWSLLPTFFYFRQYKNILNRFTIASSIGAILAPIIFGTILIYSHISALLILLIIALFISIYLISKTQSITDVTKNNHKKQQITLSPFKYPLFNTVLIISFILTVLYGLGDFLFRIQLGLNLTQEQIAIVMSAFMAVANLLSLITQFFAPQLFHRFKYHIILQGVFCLIILGAIAYWISPSIWPAMVLAAIKIVFDNGLVGIIRRNVVNIFPPAIMSKNELYIRTYISASGGIIAGFLALFSTQISIFIEYMPLIFVLLSIVGIVMSYDLFKQYISTLKNMVIISSFSSRESNQRDLQQIQKLIVDRLKKPKLNAIEVSLITPKIFPEPPEYLYKILANERSSDEIKSTILKILELYSYKKLNFKKLTEIYQSRELLSEAQRETVLKLLSYIHSKGLIESARKRLQEEPFSKNALLILLKYGDTDDYLFALKRTLELASGRNFLEREVAAKLIVTLGSGRFYDLKSKLLTDEDPQVRIAAFNSLPAQDVHDMLPSLGKFLNRNVIKILHKKFDLNEQLILAKRLMQLYEENPDEYGFSAIAFITPIQSKKVEPYIIKFLQLKQTFFRTNLSIYLLGRKKHINFSEELVHELTKALQYEVDLIAEYNNLYNHPSIRNAQIVLSNRINHAIYRFLYWYAALHIDTSNIFAMVSRLTLRGINQESKNISDKTIELLMSNESSQEIVNLMEKLFATNKPKKFVNKNTPIIFTKDEWLTKIFKQYSLEESDEMNPLQRAIALQKTDFFESLPEEVLLELGQSCELMDVAENEIIIKEGDEGDCLYVLIEGELWIYKNQNLLATLTPIKCIGEMALFGNTKRTTTVIAKQRSLLLTLSKEDFMILTNEFPQILQNVIRIIIERFSDQIHILESKGNIS